MQRSDVQQKFWKFRCWDSLGEVDVPKLDNNPRTLPHQSVYKVYDLEKNFFQMVSHLSFRLRSCMQSRLGWCVFFVLPAELKSSLKRDQVLEGAARHLRVLFAKELETLSCRHWHCPTLKRLRSLPTKCAMAVGFRSAVLSRPFGMSFWSWFFI